MRDILTITNWVEVIWTHLIATLTRIGNLDVHSEVRIFLSCEIDLGITGIDISHLANSTDWCK